MKKFKKHTVYGELLALSLLLSVCSCTTRKNQAAQERYTCPMHPEIIRDKPGTCPICFMDLVKAGESTSADGLIKLNDNQIKLANITTAPASRREMGIKTVLNGALVVNEEQTVIISS